MPHGTILKRPNITKLKTTRRRPITPTRRTGTCHTLASTANMLAAPTARNTAINRLVDNMYWRRARGLQPKEISAGTFLLGVAGLLISVLWLAR